MKREWALKRSRNVLEQKLKKQNFCIKMTHRFTIIASIFVISITNWWFGLDWNIKNSSPVSWVAWDVSYNLLAIKCYQWIVFATLQSNPNKFDSLSGRISTLSVSIVTLFGSILFCPPPPPPSLVGLNFLPPPQEHVLFFYIVTCY